MVGSRAISSRSPTCSRRSSTWKHSSTWSPLCPCSWSCNDRHGSQSHAGLSHWKMHNILPEIWKLVLCVVNITTFIHEKNLEVRHLTWQCAIGSDIPTANGGRRLNFGLCRIFEFHLGQKFVCGRIWCEFYFRILNAKQIQIFLKVCIAKFVKTNFEHVFVKNLTFM